MDASHGEPLRLLVVLSHSLHTRNFLASGLMDMLLSRRHRLTVVTPQEFVGRVRAELEDKGTLEGVEPLEPYVGGRLRERLRAISRTASYVQRSALSTYRHKLVVRSAAKRAALETWALRLLGRVVDLEGLARRVESRIPVKAAAARLIGTARPDLVVTPTFIHDTLDIEIVKAAKRLSVPTAAFPASWDTLTSKGFFLVPPDALMVWGEDSFRHAIDYHGYGPERVFVTGPPHFDMYAPSWPAESREQFLERRGIPPDKRVLLFAGTTVTYWADEPLQLRALSRLVESGGLPNCVIWYRPHPRRSYRDVTELLGLPGVHVDDQTLRQKAEGRSSYSTERDDLAHYRGLMDACDGVITAFSTMIIEAALMGKPSLVVAFGLGDEGPHRLLQHAEYEHMRDVISTPGVTLCRNPEEVHRGIRGIIGREFAPFSELLRKRASEIAHCLDGRARERMVQAIEQIGRGGL
jgi:hypothetical protein